MYALPCTLGAFALILVLARVKVPLALAILSGTVAISLLFGQGPVQLLGTLGEGAIDPTTLGMMVLTALLLTLSETMRQTGTLERIVLLTKMLLRRPRAAMAVLPALVGLLPMPGGAVFSAPMVESAASGATVDRSRLSAINYWFRHIWEHWWPLYPGVILAVALTTETESLRNTGVPTFVLYQFPLGVFMVLSGLPILLPLRVGARVETGTDRPGVRRQLLWATSSIWVILIVLKIAGDVLHHLGPNAVAGPVGSALEKFLPISVGLLVSLAWTATMNRMRPAALGRILVGGTVLKLVALVATVMVFQFVLGRVDAAGGIGKELKELRIPMTLVVVTLPFIAGMVTGLAIGFVGTSFPIVLPLLAALPGQPAIRPYIVLAYAFGHLGMMLSPLHLCQVVSNEYFKTTYGPVYRLILPSAAIMAALAAGYFLLLRALGT